MYSVSPNVLIYVYLEPLVSLHNAESICGEAHSQMFSMFCKKANGHKSGNASQKTSTHNE